MCFSLYVYGVVICGYEVESSRSARICAIYISSATIFDSLLLVCAYLQLQHLQAGQALHGCTPSTPPENPKASTPKTHAQFCPLEESEKKKPKPNRLGDLPLSNRRVVILSPRDKRKNMPGGPGRRRRLLLRCSGNVPLWLATVLEETIGGEFRVYRASIRLL